MADLRVARRVRAGLTGLQLSGPEDDAVDVTVFSLLYAYAPVRPLSSQ